MEYDLVVVGGIGVDTSALIRDWPEPEKSRRAGTVADAYWEGLGGKAAMQAVAAARQGARVALVGRLGSDAVADSLLVQLASEGVDVRHVARDAFRRTERVLLMVDHDHTRRDVVLRGSNAAFHSQDVIAASDAIRSARLVLAQLEVPVAAVAVAVQIAAEAGVPTMLDPAPAQPLPEDLVRRLHAVRADAHEASRLTGIEVRDHETARRAALKTRDRGPRIVSYEAGEDGDFLLWGEEELYLPRRAIDVIDPSGAGDAFTATLALGFVRGLDPRAAAVRANAAAALATSELGALPSLPTTDAIDAFLAASAE